MHAISITLCAYLYHTNLQLQRHYFGNWANPAFEAAEAAVPVDCTSTWWLQRLACVLFLDCHIHTHNMFNWLACVLFLDSHTHTYTHINMFHMLACVCFLDCHIHNMLLLLACVLFLDSHTHTHTHMHTTTCFIGLPAFCSWNATHINMFH